MGRKAYLGILMLTMYFSGLLIPNYMLFKNLHIINTFWVYILPFMINPFHMIIFITFFRSLPQDIEDSAKIDGTGDFYIFFKIVLPLSVPVVAVITLYNAVWNWNEWVVPYLYVMDKNLKPLQNVLVDIINATRVEEMTGDAANMFNNQMEGFGQKVTVRSLTAAAMMITTGPIILFYPFIQRYFVKGVMIGSLKG